MLKPKKLSMGDTIGIVAPASPSDKPSELPRAKHFIVASVIYDFMTRFLL